MWNIKDKHNMDIFNCIFLFILFSIFEVGECCYSYRSDTYYFCFYDLWYAWFGLFWMIFFIIILVVYCIKRHKKSRTIVVPAQGPKTTAVTHIQGPPPYSAPSQQPPAYTASAPQPPMSTNPVYPPPYPPPPANYMNDPAYPPLQ